MTMYHVSIIMASSSDVCQACSREFRDRAGKFLKKVICAKCKKQYHTTCVGLDQKSSGELARKNNEPWHCAGCRRLSVGQNVRPKSVGDQASPTPQQISSQLSSISSQLNQIKNAAAVCKDGDSLGEDFSSKIESIISDIEEIKSTIAAQNEKITELENAHIELKSENVKLKEEIKSTKISVELDKQKKLEGNLIVSGLPATDDLNPIDIYQNLCIELNIDGALSASVPKLKLVAAANKNSIQENVLYMSNLSVALQSDILNKYKQGKREKTYIRSADLVANGDSKSIYINESLTGYFQLLFKKARDLRRSGVVKYVWIKEGRLNVRVDDKSKIYQIKHSDDFQRFK
ncbi:hypothetical protein DMENIID0001_169970 [Sergentomyia squamirostris]